MWNHETQRSGANVSDAGVTVGAQHGGRACSPVNRLECVVTVWGVVTVVTSSALMPGNPVWGRRNGRSGFDSQSEALVGAERG